MSIGIIELNDAGIRVATADSDQHIAESPGIAVIGKKDLLLGEQAQRQSRLQPVQTNALFWHRLSAEPLAVHNSHYRHHADLAYSHLLELQREIPDCEQIIIALPGSFSREQMSLLLGIVGQCPFDAVGLVDSAVAASSTRAEAKSLLHVDVQLHQCVFTQMRMDGELERKQVEVLPHCGLFTLRDYWAKAIADQFIDQSRYDPLHSADAEQSLYDQLPEWLAESQQSNELFVEVNGKHLKLTRDQLITAVKPLYQQIVGRAEELMREPGQILLGDRIAGLPGLLEAFEGNSSFRTTSLSASAVMEGIRQHLELITTGTEQLRFIQALPAPGGRAERDGREEVTANEALRPATHILLGDTAYPIGESDLRLDLQACKVAGNAAATMHCSLRLQGAAVALTPATTIIVNKGQADQRKASDNCLLGRGDTISLEGGGTPLILIEVAEPYGP